MTIYIHRVENGKLTNRLPYECREQAEAFLVSLGLLVLEQTGVQATTAFNMCQQVHSLHIRPTQTRYVIVTH